MPEKALVGDRVAGGAGVGRSGCEVNGLNWARGWVDGYIVCLVYGGQPGFHLFLDELLWLPEELRQDITERFKSTDPEKFTLCYGR